VLNAIISNRWLVF